MDYFYDTNFFFFKLYEVNLVLNQGVNCYFIVIFIIDIDQVVYTRCRIGH